MLGHDMLSTSPVAFPSNRLAFSVVVSLLAGAAVPVSGSWHCGVVTSLTIWPPTLPGGTLWVGAAAEVRDSITVVLSPGAAVLPVVFVLPQIQSRSCVSEEEKQQARRSRKPKRGGAIGTGERLPLLRRVRWRGQAKESREEAGVLPQPDSGSTHIALSSQAGAHDPSNGSGVGGVALPNPPLLSASLPRSRHSPPGTARPAATHLSPPKPPGAQPAFRCALLPVPAAADSTLTASCPENPHSSLPAQCLWLKCHCREPEVAGVTHG